MLPLDRVPLEVRGWRLVNPVSYIDIERTVALSFDYEPEELHGPWVGHEESQARSVIFALAYDLLDEPSRAMARRCRMTPAGVRAALRRGRMRLAICKRTRRRITGPLRDLGILYVPEAEAL